MPSPDFVCGMYSVGHHRSAVLTDRIQHLGHWAIEHLRKDNVAKSGMTDPQIALRYAEMRAPRFVVDRANGSTFSFICRTNDARDKCEALAFRIKIP